MRVLITFSRILTGAALLFCSVMFVYDMLMGHEWFALVMALAIGMNFWTLLMSRQSRLRHVCVMAQIQQQFTVDIRYDADVPEHLQPAPINNG